MTAKLAKTSRDLLLDVYKRTRSFEVTIEALLNTNLKLSDQHERDKAMILMLAGNVDRLLKEKDTLMHVVGRMTVARLTQ